MNGPFSEFWHLNGQTFLTPVFVPIFSLGYSSSLCFHIYIKQFFAWRVICKLISKSQRIWNQRTKYEYRSTFCVIKYMNRLFFCLFFLTGRYMIGVGVQILTGTSVPIISLSYQPPPLPPETTLPPVFKLTSWPISHPRKKCPVHVVAIYVICDRIVARFGLVDG